MPGRKFTPAQRRERVSLNTQQLINQTNSMDLSQQSEDYSRYSNLVDFSPSNSGNAEFDTLPLAAMSSNYSERTSSDASLSALPSLGDGQFLDSQLFGDGLWGDELSLPYLQPFFTDEQQGDATQQVSSNLITSGRPQSSGKAMPMEPQFDNDISFSSLARDSDFADQLQYQYPDPTDVLLQQPYSALQNVQSMQDFVTPEQLEYDQYYGIEYGSQPEQGILDTRQSHYSHHYHVADSPADTARAYHSSMVAPHGTSGRAPLANMIRDLPTQAANLVNGSRPAMYQDWSHVQPDARKPTSGQWPHRLRKRPYSLSNSRIPPSEQLALGEGRRSMDSRYSNSETESPTSSERSDRPRRRRDHQHYKAERPRKDAAHPWQRTNGTTQGLSTRTGKINTYDPERDGKYVAETQHPFGSWRDGKHKFAYHRDGELSKSSYSIDAIRKFIYAHPGNNTKHGLVLWIQKMPADSANRYARIDSSKCKFVDCPTRVHKGTIMQGHFRVALDDQWTTHGDRRDPFANAAIVHLYCLERFLDFPEICRNFDVRADLRHFPSEPRARWAGRLEHEKEQELAKKFIKYCRDDRLVSKYPEYPAHDSVQKGAPKYHKGTLTYAMTVAKVESMNSSRLVTFQGRGSKNSHIHVHLGDVLMQMEARFGDKLRNKSLVSSDAEDEGKSATSRRTVKRKTAKRKMEEGPVVDNDDDADADVDGHRRSSKRRKNRSNAVRESTSGFTYADDDSESLFMPLQDRMMSESYTGPDAGLEEMQQFLKAQAVADQAVSEPTVDQNMAIDPALNPHEDMIFDAALLFA